MDTGTITNADAGTEDKRQDPPGILTFDTSSGISEEEQREIIAGIDAITLQNRVSPSPDSLRVEAKKQGGRFPLLVNLLALLVLGGGGCLLFLLHQQDTLKFRQGTSYLGITERRLIQEIRRETTGKMTTKEEEIAGVMDQLAEINRELQNLQQSVDTRIQEKEAELRQQMYQEVEAERKRLMEENVSDSTLTEGMRVFEGQKQRWLNTELTAFKEQLDRERIAAEAELQKLREEYQYTLTQLQAERVQILEASRIREENLYAQLQEKTGEFNGLQQSRQEVGAARDELYRLTDEWERSALIDRELSGFYTTVNNQIQERHLPAAAQTLGAMREFLNTPSFQNLRPIQSRKELYIASINVLSEIVEGSLWANSPKEPPVSPGIPAAPEAPLRTMDMDYETIIAELKAQNATLEQTIGEQDQRIASLRNQNSSVEQSSGNYENTINTLRRQNTSLQQTLSTRDTTINTLRNQNTGLQQIVAAHEITIREFRTQNTSLQQTLTVNENTINELKTQAAGLQQTLSVRDSAINTLRTQNTSLGQTVSTRDSTISDLRTQNTTLQQTVNTRDSTISDLRTQNTTLQQTVNTRDSTISDLRTQNTTLQQTVNTRDGTISDLRTQNTNLQQRVELLQQTNEAVRKLLNQ